VQSLVLLEVQEWAPTKKKKIKQTKTTSLTASNIKRGVQTCFQQWTIPWTKYYVQKGGTFRVTTFHSIHILFITNYNQVPETSPSSHINILSVFSFHCSCWSTDDLPPSPITPYGYTSSNFPPDNWHISFFPTTSASTWPSICHSTLICYIVQKPKKTINWF